MTPVSTASSGGVGQARLRVEDRALLTGRGRFTDDIRIAGCLHAAFVRSPEAQGRIAAVDTAEAAAMPGVVRIFTGQDLAGLGSASVNPLMPELRPLPPQPLAVEAVAAVGAPVALVVAETAAAALDAAEAVFVDIEPPPLQSPDGAAAAYRARETWRSQPAGEARNAAARATVSLRQPLLAPAALEPRGLVADAATEPGRLTVWLGSQSPHRAREELAAVLGLDPDLVRVVAPDVGGAFGMKASLYPEDIAVAFAARALGRCVKWIATRSEEFLAATQGRGQTVEAGLSAAATERCSISTPRSGRRSATGCPTARSCRRATPGASCPVPTRSRLPKSKRPASRRTAPRSASIAAPAGRKPRSPWNC